MKRFFIKGTDNEVTVGSLLKIGDESDLKVLTDCGILDCVEEKKDLAYYIDLLIEKSDLEYFSAFNCFSYIKRNYPSAFFSIVLKEIAEDIDSKYPDHIRNSQKIYAVSLADGTITEIPKGKIKNYRNFAAFRNISDAKKACRITRNLLKGMFKDE